ncbi:hypothetical protein PGT21_022624 [Puccinia graminis f. sp. tritici]|uniref:Uncharacterized protein n=1 Tax=Puccinia graminis f. sp. tritici TaxID=56615 RepID=A0A5B0MLW3_PUCGR|nr:hypothetical protein PGT21_022624 [Puccinia graminis f. sp. tritici]
MSPLAGLPKRAFNHRLNHRRSPSAGTVRRPSTRAQSSPRTHNNRSNISIGDGRFNPMRGVQNTSQGTNVRGATSQEVPSGYANIFEQEQGPRLDHSGSELGSGDDHIDEEGPPMRKTSMLFGLLCAGPGTRCYAAMMELQKVSSGIG